jgi:hypothetical protein
VRAKGDLVDSLGYSHSTFDECLFFKHDDEGKVSIVCLYVDDYTLAPSSESVAQELLAFVTEHYHGEPAYGELNFMLGVKVQRLAQGEVKLSQEAFAKEIVEAANLASAPPTPTPMEHGVLLIKEDLTQEEKQTMDATPYASICCKVLYLSTHTRPDIAFATNRLCQFLVNPSPTHWKALKHLVRYIAGTADLGLVYSPGSSVTVEAYVDANFGERTATMKCTGGHILYIAGAPVAWHSGRHATVALSSTESELDELILCGKEVLWTRGLLAQLGYAQHAPTKCHEDNQGVIAMVTKPGPHYGRTKHALVKVAAAREWCQVFKAISLPYIKSQDC